MKTRAFYITVSVGVKHKTLNISSDCSLSENSRCFGYDLKNGGPVSRQALAR